MDKGTEPRKPFATGLLLSKEQMELNKKHYKKNNKLLTRINCPSLESRVDWRSFHCSSRPSYRGNWTTEVRCQEFCYKSAQSSMSRGADCHRFKDANYGSCDDWPEYPEKGCASCVTFALISVAASCYYIQKGIGADGRVRPRTIPLYLSESALLWPNWKFDDIPPNAITYCGHTVPSDHTPCCGWYVDPAIGVAETVGLFNIERSEEQWCQCSPCQCLPHDLTYDSQKKEPINVIWHGSVDTIQLAKDHLLRDGPLITAIFAYRSLFEFGYWGQKKEPTNPGDVSSSDKTKFDFLYSHKRFCDEDYDNIGNENTVIPDQILGPHAVCVVGYQELSEPLKEFWNEKDHRSKKFQDEYGKEVVIHGYWIVKNSWGRDWGDDGYFYVPYGEVVSTGEPYSECDYGSIFPFYFLKFTEGPKLIFKEYRPFYDIPEKYLQFLKDYDPTIHPPIGELEPIKPPFPPIPHSAIGRNE